MISVFMVFQLLSLKKMMVSSANPDTSAGIGELYNTYSNRTLYIKYSIVLEVTKLDMVEV